MVSKKLLITAIAALILTMFMAASFHMLILFYMAISKGDYNYINLFTIVGLTFFWPNLQSTFFWFIAGWIILAIILSVVFYILRKLKISIF